MFGKQKDFDNVALRTLSEKYLANKVFCTDILNFLTKNPTIIKAVEKDKIISILADNAGKAQNSIYKHRNGFTNYSAVSFFRYWQAMLDICKTNNVPEKEIPTLDNIFHKYSDILGFINQISIEEDLKTLVIQHVNIFVELDETFEEFLRNPNKKGLTNSEKSLLINIKSELTPITRDKSIIKMREQRERMHRK